jgi:hypothetical protein
VELTTSDENDIKVNREDILQSWIDRYEQLAEFWRAKSILFAKSKLLYMQCVTISRVYKEVAEDLRIIQPYIKTKN